MISKNLTQLPSELRAVQRQFEKWRASRPRLMRIPDSLWRAAVSLYPRHSLNQICRVLHLENTALWRHVPPSARHAGRAAGSQRFIELAPSAETGSGEYLIEVQDAEGRVVRVRLAGFRGVDQVVEVVRRLRQETA